MADDDPASAFRVEGLHDRVVATIREMIMRGQLKPSARISEKDLCDLFGISRTPLREALKVLASEGLIELPPRRGARVAPMSRGKLCEQFEGVAVIEANAARVMACRGAAKDIERLRAIHDRMMLAFESRQEVKYFADHDKFHNLIMAAAGNNTLSSMHATLITHLHRAKALGQTETSEPDPAIAASHTKILEAIERRDGEAAANEAMKHRVETADDVLAALERSATELVP